ncbi:MAG: Mfa1 family fimbria major subunit [Muribaculaceae bacterium]
MKIKSIILSVLAFTALMSCQKEGLDNPDNGQTGEKTFAGISISFPLEGDRSVSRAADDGNAIASEKAVKSVGIYIVDKAKRAIMQSALLTAADFTVTNGICTVNKTIATTTGAKLIYAVLNPSDEVKAQIASENGYVFTNARELSMTVDKFGLAWDAATNRPKIDGTGALTMSSDVAVEKTLTVMTEEEAKKNPIALKVQRNTAKVAVKDDAKLTVIGGESIGRMFTLAAIAKTSYLVQQKSGGNIITPATIVPTDAGDLVTYFAKHYTALSKDETAYGKWNNVNASTATNTTYNGYFALENNVNAKHAGNTTAAIIKGNFTPTEVVLTADAAGNILSKGAGVDGQSFYVQKSTNYYWSTTAYNTYATDDTKKAEFSKIYTSGVGYYRIWVQNTDKSKSVKRNSYYVLNITKINGPGSPEIPTDPVDPVEEDTQISVTIEILPWTMQGTDHEIS